MVASEIGNYDMNDLIFRYGKDSTLTSLTPKFNGKSPDDSVSYIQYEKSF